MRNNTETLVTKTRNLRETSEVRKTKVETERNLTEIANQTYAEVANRYGEYFTGGPKEIYWQNACQQFSELIRKKLAENGTSSEFEHRDVKKINPKARHHIFVSTPDYYIDGTWQQFLEHPRKDNHLLILNKKNVASDLEKANVPRELWFIYGVN